MDLTRAEKFRLGVFVAVGGALFIGAIAVLTGAKLMERRDRYHVSFHESVLGLQPSAAVLYQGLRVGVVERLAVDPDDPTAIRVSLSLNPGTELFVGTKAVLELRGLTGLKVVNLTPGDPAAGPLPPGSAIAPGASLFAKLTERAEGIFDRIERVSVSLERWTGSENRERVERLVDSATRLVDHVDGFVLRVKDPLAESLSEVAKSGASFRRFSNEAAATMRSSRSEVTATLASARGSLDEVRRILAAVEESEMKDTLRSANIAMRSLKQALDKEELGKALVSLRESLVNLSQLAQDLDLSVRAGREDLVLSLKYIRQASEDLREFSRLIAQDPSVLVRGTEGPSQ